MLSRLCEFLMEVPHGLHWCIFHLILFMGGCLVFGVPGGLRSLSLPLRPFLGCPRSCHFSDEHRPAPRPVLHPLVCLVPVWMCSLVHHALLRSISLALTVVLWQVKTSRKGFSSLGSERWVFLSEFLHSF